MNGLVSGGGGPYPRDAEMMQGKISQAPSLKSRLAMAVKDAESRLADAVRAKEIFVMHPELEALLNIMQRGRF